MDEKISALRKKVYELETENKELDSKVIELYVLYNISKKLNLVTELDEFFSKTVATIGNSLQIKDFCIMLMEGPEGRLVTSSYIGDSDMAEVTLRKGEGVLGRAVLAGKTTLLKDVTKEPDFLFYSEKKKRIGAFLCIPLKDKSGTVLGVLNAHKPIPDSFTVKDIELFEDVANQISVTIEKAISYMNVQELSIKDELTGLYNRRYFFDYLDKEFIRSRRYKRKISLIMVDIDRFKIFNDNNGHLMGDMALKLVAQTLGKNLRKSDILVRYGGEEFVILLPETGKNVSLEVTEKLREAVCNEKINGEEHQPGGRLTATFGVSTFPDDAVYATELLGCADKALYYGKKGGRNIVIPYTEGV